MTGDLSNLSLSELFRLEVESQAQVLIASLLALEREPGAADQLEACMRAAHSLKGAARIVGLTAGVDVAHALEDCFVAAQNGRLVLHRTRIDLLLRGVDLLKRIGQASSDDAGQPLGEERKAVDTFLAALAETREDPEPSPPAGPLEPESAPASGPDTSDRFLRVTAENLNRMLALAGEARVESRWLKPFADSLLRLKRLQRDLGKTLDQLRDTLASQALSEPAQDAQSEAQRRVLECQQFLGQRLAELEMFDRRSVSLSHRLYAEALAVRMRPFADGIQGFPRMVRDVSRSLGKPVKLEIAGEATQVDRDILGKLEAPLGHLLRNAIDHGLESPTDRSAAGKPAEGTIRLEARHSAGTLQIVVADDGRGVDLDQLRATVIRRNLADAETARQLSESELLEFLFLPGFTLRESVTEISGRGVGLDVVQNMVRQVRGTVRVTSQPGQGARFLLQLPLTLSVLRTLLVEIGGEPYAFPLAHLVRTLRLKPDRIEWLEGRQHFDFEGRRVGLVAAHQVLETREPESASDELPVIVVGGPSSRYGLVVDRFLGERELIVQPLDPRLGKIPDVSAAALMEDGAPVLILDAEDVVRSVEKLIAAGQLNRVRDAAPAREARTRKRVLVVDDSLTVREVERKLLRNHGYEVEVAVNGLDGWNAVRTNRFDLVITDIDMPRMDGIELVTLIKQHATLQSLPVMIVSYKDREEDRQRGLNAGADYYLTKASFHDETLLRAVADLIGGPNS